MPEQIHNKKKDTPHQPGYVCLGRGPPPAGGRPWGDRRDGSRTSSLARPVKGEKNKDINEEGIDTLGAVWVGGWVWVRDIARKTTVHLALFRWFGGGGGVRGMNHLEVFVLGFGCHLLQDLRRGRVFLHETRNSVSVHGHVPATTVAFVITRGSS